MATPLSSYHEAGNDGRHCSKHVHTVFLPDLDSKIQHFLGLRQRKEIVMRTRSSCVVFTTLAFVILILPFPAGAVVDWTNRSETNLGPGSTGAWDDSGMGSPKVIKDGSVYKMWYTGKSSTGPYQIGYATSSDGFAWIKHAANPIITPADAGTWDGLPVQHIGESAVIKNGSNYEMWYTALTGTPDEDNPQIGYATSSDGITWAHHGSPVLRKGPASDWDTSKVWNPAVIKDDSTYKMWYMGSGRGLQNIGYATSPDGINWTKYNNSATTGSPWDSSDPVIWRGPSGSWYGDNLGSPTVIKEDTKLHLWFYGESGGTDGRSTIGYAYSGDGISWKTYNGNPLLHGTFEGGGLSNPTVIKDGNTYRMWYDAGTGASGKINYAESYAYQGNTLSFDKVTVMARYELTRSGLNFSIKGRFPSPLDITQCTVSGPNSFSTICGDSQIGNDEKDQSIGFFVPITGGVTPSYSGTYTFTIKANNGLTATKSVDLAVSPMTAPDETALDRYVNVIQGTNVYAGAATPILKWKPCLGDNYYYRVNVMDWKQGASWYISDWVLGSSKGSDGYMSVTIPSGYLKADTPYKWKVQIADTNPTGNSAYNRIDSGWYAFHTGAKGTGNFLNRVVFNRFLGYIEGKFTGVAAFVTGLAPWDIATVDPNKFRVENETYTTPYYYTFAPNADALTTDSLPFYYYKPLYNTSDIADTSSLGYKFFVSDGSNSSELYATYMNPSIALPRLTRDQMTPRDNAYLQTLEPTLTWKSQGTAYTYVVTILDWNNLRSPYRSSYLDGLEAGQDMSITVPAGILQGSNPYRWFVEIYDSGKYNRSRSEFLSFMTPSAAVAYSDTVQKIYIGYYQRPADPGGLIYWAGKLDSAGGSFAEIIEAYANSAESLALYGTINNSNISTVVNGIYYALFGRGPEPGGLSYYVNGFNSGQFTAATIMLNVLYGAQNEDLQSVNNKLTAANLFTMTINPELDGTNFQATYAEDGDAIAARNFLALYATSVKVPTQAETTAYIKANIADPGDAILTP